MAKKALSLLRAAQLACGLMALALAVSQPALAETDFYRTFTNPYTGGRYLSPGASYLATVMRNQALRQSMRQAAFAGLTAGQPSFKIVNTGTTPITSVFLLREDRSEWSGNLLGEGQSIRVAHEAKLNVAPGSCRNGVRVIFADGSKWQHLNIDTCVPTRVAFPNPE